MEQSHHHKLPRLDVHRYGYALIKKNNSELHWVGIVYMLYR